MAKIVSCQGGCDFLGRFMRIVSNQNDDIGLRDWINANEVEYNVKPIYIVWILFAGIGP